jgi:putative ABC transport system permease protein
MSTLGWKNLFHDKVRLVVTLTGIVFALVLIIIQFGLFLGFIETSANVVDRSGVDLWIAAAGIPHVNGASPIPERRRFDALSVPGIAQAEPYILLFVNWKLPSGAQESVQITGFDLASGMGGPWDLTAGRIEDLHGDDTVIVDELYCQKLGIRGVGDQVEILGRRARVVGLTRGIRSFTTSPYVFTSFKNAQNYASIPAGETLFVVAKLTPGADLHQVKQQLQAALPNSAVLTNREMLERTRHYWVFATGAGVTTLMGAVLGLLVGIVVVAQTIYAATMDHIREFGTLKAMGASNLYLYRVILEQALISAVMGYVLAIIVGWLVVRASEGSEITILLPPEMMAGTLALALLMCVLASVISIRKATTIDPALVFKN